MYYNFTLDCSPRHCWDNSCDNPTGLTHGNPEFLRWIREFGILEPGIVTGFPDGSLSLGEKYSTTQERHIYCENYSGRVLVFLDHKKGEAYIEIVDVTLIPAAKEARDLVSNQYAEETYNAAHS